MQKQLPAAVFGILLFGFYAFTNDVLQQLALSEREAKEAIRDNFINGGLYFPNNQTIRAIAIAKRSATVSSLGDYMKQYVHSAEFAQAYAEARQAAKPEGKADVKELIKTRLEEIDREISETEEKIKEVTGPNKKLYEISLQSLRDEKKALNDPKNPKHADYVENLTEVQDAAGGQMANDAASFEETYPATVKELVRKRLKEFLAFTANMPFGAQLVQQGKFKVFADPALEAKDGDWKRCFRAGPETIGAARAYAQKWLQELDNRKGL